MMISYISFLLIFHLTLISSGSNLLSFQRLILFLLTKFQCGIHDLTDTYKNEIEISPYNNRTVSQITSSWQSTFPDGNYRFNTKNTIPYNQMALRDPDTILRMAEYQAMMYCQSDANLPDISSVINMATKNLRVGNFSIEATGFDKDNLLFWYIASNVAQQSIILVHRGTRGSDSADVFDDLDDIKVSDSMKLLNLDFPFLAKLNDVSVDTGFYLRFRNEKVSIVSALRQTLGRYSSPSFSFIVVGHSLGAAWAFLNAAYFTSLTDINQRMTAVYTFGQPLLGSTNFVDAITSQLNTPVERYVRTVNLNDAIPHVGCKDCTQPQYANEKWVMNTTVVTWKDCNGGQDLTCSSTIPCSKLSWSNHSAVGQFSMRGEFCRIASNA